MPPANPYAKRPPRFTAASVRQDADKQPPRIIMHGVESIGKSSFAAFGPSPLFLMGDGETGLLTLIRAKTVPETTSYLPPLENWQDVLDALTFLESDDAPAFSSLCIDTLGSLEKHLHVNACQTRYGGDWAKFVAYGGSGENTCLDDWRLLLHRLDAIRSKTSALVIGLAHTKVTNFKNPDGPDYDRYQAQLSKIGWEACKQWADVVLFANFSTVVKAEKGKAKGKAEGGADRVIYTERRAAYDAKNRYGLPAEIEIGSQPGDGWAAFAAAMGVNLAG